MSKDTIKRLGMRKEFDNWVKNINKRNVFQVGTRIQIVKTPSKHPTVYSIGDKGTIISDIGHKISPEDEKKHMYTPIVQFDFGGNYFIDKKYMRKI